MTRTKRKSNDQEMARQNGALTRQVFELRHANRELEAFSQAISHDLRASLTRIHVSGQALQEYQDRLDPNGLFFVKTINDGCTQVEAMLNALTALSRVTETELVTDQVDLSRIAVEMAAELHLTEPDRRACFRITPQLRVQGDPQLLPLAMENLIRNAWKYTAHVSEPVIELGSFVSADGETIFFLKDNGAGFDSARTEQLFKPFQRLHPSQEFPGTGLGLATVQRIIRRHNGRIWGEGNPGRGATFYFTVNA